MGGRASLQKMMEDIAKIEWKDTSKKPQGKKKKKKSPQK
jgi:hypothetical protein